MIFHSFDFYFTAFVVYGIHSADIGSILGQFRVRKLLNIDAKTMNFGEFNFKL